MATITKKTTPAGKVRYKADIRIRESGQIIHRESKTFDRKRLAVEWAKSREHELQEPGALERVAHGGVSVRLIIERYEELFKPADGWGRSKAYDLHRLKKYPLADLSAVALTVGDLVEHAKFRAAGGTGPATIANDLIWLGVEIREWKYRNTRTPIKINSL